MNRRNFKTIIFLGVVVSAAGLFFNSCQKKSPSLGNSPSASFTSVSLTPTSDSTAWNVELINTTPTPSIAYWNIPGVGTFKGDTVKVVVQYAGNYSVQLTVSGQGGQDSTSQTINVPQDNPYTVKANFKYQVLTPVSFANPQNLELINTSLYSIGESWDVTAADGSSIGSFTGDTVKVTIPNAGAYTVKLTATGKGNLTTTGNVNLTATATQTVTIAQDNPYGLDPNGIFGVLDGSGIGLTQRTWIPNRAIDACWVGNTGFTGALSAIDAASTAPWWGFGPGEIATDGTGRDGYLDDQFTFITSGKKFIYNDNNTVYLDNGSSPWTKALPSPWKNYSGTYASTRDSTISGSSQSPAASTAVYGVVSRLQPWGSGTFTYSIHTSGGAMGLGTITVNGLGAHLGLADKTNGGETEYPTATSITYDVLRISTGLTDTTTGATYDEIIIGLVYDAGGDVWVFRLRSDRP